MAIVIVIVIIAGAAGGFVVMKNLHDHHLQPEASESYMVVFIGAVIVVQQFIMYLMYVQIRQHLKEVNSIEGKMKITDHELDSLIKNVEELKSARRTSLQGGITRGLTGNSGSVFRSGRIPRRGTCDQPA